VNLFYQHQKLFVKHILKQSRVPSANNNYLLSPPRWKKLSTGYPHVDKLSTSYAQGVDKLCTSYPQNGFFAFVKRHAGRHAKLFWNFWRILTIQKLVLKN
jgi:hypothetical protein